MYICMYWDSEGVIYNVEGTADRMGGPPAGFLSRKIF